MGTECKSARSATRYTYLRDRVISILQIQFEPILRQRNQLEN